MSELLSTRIHNAGYYCSNLITDHSHSHVPSCKFVLSPYLSNMNVLSRETRAEPTSAIEISSVLAVYYTTDTQIESWNTV